MEYQTDDCSRSPLDAEWLYRPGNVQLSVHSRRFQIGLAGRFPQSAALSPLAPRRPQSALRAGAICRWRATRLPKDSQMRFLTIVEDQMTVEWDQVTRVELLRSY
jgi:hypothetical protein